MSSGRYEAKIGLECHVQLRVASKLFCACPVVDPGAGGGGGGNAAVCPICLGHPGALPTLNGGAVRLGVRAALALGAHVAPVSRFARKHYFYPDLPKGYQITQGAEPLATGGAVHIHDRACALVRMHLEEDAGRLYHTPAGVFADWDRAGVPLLEIVGAADLTSPEEAEAWLRTLHRTLVAAGVTTGDLESGHLRCDANVSVARPGEGSGARVEIKNVNSFRFVRAALAAEIERQVGVLEAGGVVLSETRGWTGTTTRSLRAKETSAEYRLLDEPDLPPLVVPEAEVAAARAALPGAPLDRFLAAQDTARRDAWRDRFGLGPAEVAALLADAEVAALFEGAVALGGEPRALWGLFGSFVLRRRNEGRLGHLGAAHLAGVAQALAAGRLSHDRARTVLDTLAQGGGDVAGALAALPDDLGDDSVRALVARVVGEAPGEAARYRAGQSSLVGFFVGRVMAASGRRADPRQVERLVRESLDGTDGSAPAGDEPQRV